MSYSKCFGRTQIGWVIWRSSKKDRLFLRLLWDYRPRDSCKWALGREDMLMFALQSLCLACPIWLDDRGTGQWKRMEEVPRSYLARTPCVPLFFLLCLIGVETEALLDYQGRAGIISIVRWNLRPVIFGVENSSCKVTGTIAYENPMALSLFSCFFWGGLCCSGVHQSQVQLHSYRQLLRHLFWFPASNYIFMKNRCATYWRSTYRVPPDVGLAPSTAGGPSPPPPPLAP